MNESAIPVYTYTPPTYRDTLILSRAIKLYLSQKRSEGFSPNTLKNKEFQLHRLLKGIGDRPVSEITLADLRTYVSTFDHLKASTRGITIRTIRPLFKWLVEEEFLDKNPALRLREPKLPKPVPKHLTIEELEHLREACQTVFQHALLETFFATAARIDELYKMNRSEIRLADRSIIVHGKGNKDREVYLGAKARIWLSKYLETRNDDSPAAFITLRKINGEYCRMSKDTLRRHMNQISTRAGLRDKVTPHVMRHTVATILLNNGASLAVVQSYLGHEKPETTLRYATLSGTARRNEFDRFFSQ